MSRNKKLEEKLGSDSSPPTRGEVFSRNFYKEKIEDIKLVLELTKSSQLALQSINQIISTYKDRFSYLPAFFWDNFIEEAAGNTDQVLELLLPIYDKYFTHEEIKQLIDFYSSAFGKKVITTQPLIMKESYTVGEQRGQMVAGKIRAKLKEIG